MNHSEKIKKIERELAAVSEPGEVEETDLEAVAYEPAMLTIVRTITVGDVDDHIRVELHQDGLAFETPGAVISFAETVVKALVGENRPPEKSISLVVNAPGLTAGSLAAVESLAAVALSREALAQRASGASEAEALETALREAEKDQAECASEHAERVKYLRDLIVQARKDKRADDAARTSAGEDVMLAPILPRKGDLQQVVLPGGATGVVNARTGGNMSVIVDGRAGYVTVPAFPDLPEDEPVPGKLHIGDAAAQFDNGGSWPSGLTQVNDSDREQGLAQDGGTN